MALGVALGLGKRKMQQYAPFVSSAEDLEIYKSYILATALDPRYKLSDHPALEEAATDLLRREHAE